MGMMEHVHHTSSIMYGVDELRPMHQRIFVTLFVQKLCQALFVDQTADGKSPVIILLGTMLKGVHLYFCSLLTIMADVIVKFQQGDERYGRIIVVNLDELGGNHILCKIILKLLRDMKSSTAAMFFLVSSP